MIKKIIVTLAITIALIILLLVALDKLNKERCGNLPLNDFYNDKSCLKYTEELDD